MCTLHNVCVCTHVEHSINPLNPTGGLFYRCIYPKGRYSGLSIYRHNPTGLYSGQMAKTSYGEILRVERFNGYCRVVYLYIYIALHAVHTNQKHFQCKRPREKRAVLRERKEALGSPVSKVDRVEGVGSRKRKQLVTSYRTCTNIASYQES